MPLSRRLFAQVFAATLASPAFARADWFESLDQDFEDTFQATDAAFDRAMENGVASLDQELNALWGRQRRLPEPKIWVGYLDNRQTRVIIDYEKGEVSLESQNADEKRLRETFERVLSVPEEEWNNRDILRERLIESTRPIKNVERKPVRFVPQKKVSHPKPDRLSNLVEKNNRPRFVSRSEILHEGRAPIKLARLSTPLKPERERFHLSAQALQDPIEEAARRYDLPRALILSVIKNESSFNPRARSHANALGLMQLVPTSGGKDAYAYLTGNNGIPAPEILYDPYQNILLGSTYLHILRTRYFDKVQAPLSQQHMMIAAYNTGAGNVAKAFVGSMKVTRAVNRANEMSPEQVYNHLIAHLPYEETRHYLRKVTRDKQTFAHWDHAHLNSITHRL